MTIIQENNTMARVRKENLFKAHFGQGIVNKISPELLKNCASSESSNFIAGPDKIELVGGRSQVGHLVESNVPCRGLHSIQNNDGTWILFRKLENKLQYFDFSSPDWIDILTGLTDAPMYFANSYTPAGRQVWINGEDGLFKIYPSAPMNPINLTDPIKNFKGRIMILGSRMYLWGRNEDPTGLYYSRVDKDDNYTFVEGEAVGSIGGTSYSGTLAKTQVFGLLFTDGTINIRDDKDGRLLLDEKVVGSINYATGEYEFTLEVPTSGDVIASYLWEDPLDGGLADFTYSAVRLAGEGNILRQDAVGTESMLVTSFDNKIYTLQNRGSWRLFMAADDLEIFNEIFNQHVSCPSPEAGVPAADGLIYIDTSDEREPKLKLLGYNQVGDKVVPYELSKLMTFEHYDFSEAAMILYNGFIIFSCKSEGAARNDTTFAFNLETKGFSQMSEGYRYFTIADKKLYGGDSGSPNVFELFNCYDDLGETIRGYWISGNHNQDTEQVKKFKRFFIEGYLSHAQAFDIYASYDRDPFVKIGRITMSDVMSQEEFSFGSLLYGDDPYGGDDTVITGAKYFRKFFRVVTPKYERVRFKFVPTGIGYLAIHQFKISDLRLKGSKILRKVRQR